jgi:tetratricopeptide (TPR) repeat protein
VGRQTEVEALCALFDEARDAGGAVAVLVGEPGIGKTRTAEELAARLRRRRVQVHWGRCLEGEGAPAFWPWIQIVRSCVEAGVRTARRDLGDSAGAIAHLVPELHARWRDLGRPAALDGEPARFQLFDALTRYLRRIAARRPTLLILDDLHWADTPSLLLLQFLAREIADSPLMVVGTYRDIEVDADHPLAGVVNELRRTRRFQQLALRGLPKEAVQALIAGLGGQGVSEAFAHRVFHLTDGNPFFIEETLRHLVEEGSVRREDGRWVGSVPAPGIGIPEGARALIGRRLARLSPLCRRVLAVAAAVGREVPRDVLHGVLGAEVPAEALATALAEARAARILGDRDAPKGHDRFAHALIREALYKDIEPADRRQLHAAIGRVLEQLGDTDVRAAQLAHHFMRAADSEDAVLKATAYARRAGERAAAVFAYEDAVQQYGRGLELLESTRPAPADVEQRAVWDRQCCTFLLALAEAQMHAGEPAAAAATWRRAADLARALGDAEALARVALGVEMVSSDLGGAESVERYLTLLEEAAAALGPGDSLPRARVLARLARVPHRSVSRQRREALSQEAEDMARRFGDPATLGVALLGRNYALWDTDEPSVRLARADETVRCAEAGGDRPTALEGRLLRTAARFELGDIAAVDVEIRRYAELAEQLRQPRYRWMAGFLRAGRACLDGRFAEAEQLAQEAYAVGQQFHERNAAQVLGVQLLALRREQGRLSEIEPVARALADEYPTVASWRCALALLYSEIEALADARAEFERLAAHEFAAVPVDPLWLTTTCALAEVCATLGDRERAAQLYAQLHPHAQRHVVLGPCVVSLGSVSRYLGLLAATLGRIDDAAHHFDAALRFHVYMGAIPLQIRTQYDWAAVAVQRGHHNDRQTALGLLRPAFDGARRLGMARLAGQIETLLRRTGVSPAAAALPAVRHGRRRAAPAGGLESVFRHEGEFWTIAHAGTVIRLRDTRGLRYLACLVTHPDQEIHVSDLIAAAQGGAGGAWNASWLRRAAPLAAAYLAGATQAMSAAVAEVLPWTADVTGGGPMLDARAKAAYRQRLEELREEIAEAERYNDGERAGRLSEERDAIAQQLKAALRPGGRDRQMTPYAERARLAVTQGVRSAIRRIQSGHPTLGRHLMAAVKTGYFCAYRPAPDAKVTWTT